MAVVSLETVLLNKLLFEKVKWRLKCLIVPVLDSRTSGGGLLFSRNIMSGGFPRTLVMF